MELKPETVQKLYIIKLLGCAALLLFSVLLVLYEYQVIHRPISAVFLPLYPVLIALPICLHLVLSNFAGVLRKFSTLVLLTSTYFAAISVVVFLICIGLSIDNSISATWAVVFVPLWFGLFSYFLLCAFLFPGLREQQLHRNSFIIFLYFFAILTTSILVVSKLDSDSISSWSCVLSPLWAGLALHCLSFGLCKLKPESKECFTAEKIFLIYASFELLLVNLRLETSGVPLWLVFLPFWLSLGVWLVYIEVQYYKPALPPSPEQGPLLQRQQTV